MSNNECWCGATKNGYCTWAGTGTCTCDCHQPRHQEARHGDAVFIVVSPDVNHLKIAKGMRIYEISLH